MQNQLFRVASLLTRPGRANCGRIHRPTDGTEGCYHAGRWRRPRKGSNRAASEPTYGGILRLSKLPLKLVIATISRISKMPAARFAMTLAFAIVSGIAAGATIRVEFEAELNETEGAAATARNVKGSFSFDDSEARSAASSLLGPFVQTELIDFTIVTELGRTSANIGQVMHFGDSRPGAINRPFGATGLVYSVTVGVVSYPALEASNIQPSESGFFLTENGIGVDFDDLHTFHSDFPWVSSPLLRLTLAHTPVGDLTQRSLRPPSMEEIDSAQLTVYVTAPGTLFPTYSSRRLVYDVTSLRVIPEPSSSVLAFVGALMVGCSYLRRPGVGQPQRCHRPKQFLLS